MLTSSCIRRPEKYPLIIIRKWQVDFFWDLEELVQAMEASPLNNQKYTDSGTDFFKKHKTLRKCIREFKMSGNCLLFID